MAQQNPTYADGASSLFPASLDDWGDVLANNVHTKVTAARWNQISDAVVKLQQHTLQVMLVGQAGVLTPDTGADRPAMLSKVFTATVTGSAQRSKVVTIPGPLFTTAEKNLFGGTPLASGNAIHLWVRKAAGDSFAMTAYQAGLNGFATDPSGDSGLSIGIVVLGQDQWQATVAGGTYTVTCLVTN